MKKILVLTTVHPSDDNRILHREILSLVKNYDVTYITTDDKSKGYAKKINVDYFSLGEWRSRFERISLNLRAFRKALGINYDLLIFHDFEFIVFALFLKIFKKGKVVFDMHEDYPGEIMGKYWIPKVMRWSVSIFASLCERLFLPVLDGLIVVSEGLCKRKAQCNKSILILGNVPNKKVFPIKLLETNKEVEFVILGDVTEVRGGEIVLKALNLSKNNNNKFTLKIIGDIKPDSLKSDYNLFLKSGRVKVTGRLPYKEAITELSKGTVGLLTYLSNSNHDISSPNKLYEYMAAGLPVISSNISNYGQVISSCRNGILYESNDYLSLYKAMCTIFNKNLVNMSKRGRQCFENKYNWSIESEKLLDYVESLWK